VVFDLFAMPTQQQIVDRLAAIEELPVMAVKMFGYACCGRTFLFGCGFCTVSDTHQVWGRRT